MNEQICAIDLYCGAGGLSHGFIKEGIDVRAGIDIDPACEYAFSFNNHSRFINCDIKKLSGKDLCGLYPEKSVKILAGCAPCQPFSSYSRNKNAISDKRWGLLNDFARLIFEFRPDIVTMENVTRLENHEVYDNFVERVEECGYFTSKYHVFCPDYGIPQTRKRLVFFASRFGTVELIPKTHAAEGYVKVRDAISDLPVIRAGETCVSDPLHQASSLSDLNLRRIKASKPGGTWRDWDEDLLTACHRKPEGKKYVSVYGRMEWDKPSPTITTQCYGYGNGRFGHPEQDRAISLREAALLQTFPRGYRFFRSETEICMKSAARMIGNAVPVELGRVIAESIKRHLEVFYE